MLTLAVVLPLAPGSLAPPGLRITDTNAVLTQMFRLGKPGITPDSPPAHVDPSGSPQMYPDFHHRHGLCGHSLQATAVAPWPRGTLLTGFLIFILASKSPGLHSTPSV